MAYLIVDMKEDLKYIFANTNDWLKFAEAKHGALITFNIATIFGVFQLVDKLQSTEDGYKIAFAMVIVTLIAAAMVSLYAFFPITSIKIDHLSQYDFDAKKTNLNILYYGHVHNLKDEQLIELYNITTNNTTISSGLEQKIAHQIVNNACITNQKFLFFKWAGYITWLGVFGFALLFFLKYVVDLKI